MLFGVITNFNGKMYEFCTINENMTSVTDIHIVSEQDILIRASSFKPLNFSIGGSGVLQDNGSFTRLQSNKVVLIVLKELVSRSGRVLGYTCMNVKTKVISNIKKDEILSNQSRQEEPLIQNAIIRNGGICAYPNQRFLKEVVGNKKPATGNKTQVKPAQMGVSNKDVRDTAGNLHRKVPDYISNPNLSKEQRKVLLTAKKNGACVEYFNIPNMSPDVMKFYGEVLDNKELAEDCKPILNNTKLSLDQVSELYQCALVGVPYADICDENLSPMDMRIKCQERSMELWGDIDTTEKPDEDLMLKAMRVARDLKS